MAQQDIGDLEKIRQTIQAWLAANIDNASDVVLADVKFPEASGESSVTLILDATIDGAQHKYVFRMAPPHSEVFDSHDIGLQYRLLEIMAEAGVPVPGLVGYEPNAALVGSDFYVMNFTDGQIPVDSPPYSFGSWVTELDDSQRSTMWRNGLQVLAQVHKVDISRYALPELPRAAAGQSVIQHEIDKFDQMMTPETAEALPPVVLEALDYLKANAPQHGELRLCWGDSRVGNMIWQDLAPVAVIDWEMANLGDPLQDVSWWFWIDYINSVGLGVPRLGGVPDRAETYQQWHQHTGLSIDNTDYYDLFTVVRYSIILERKFASMKAAGMGTIENFAAAYVPDLLKACRAGA
jgi:aminoglycoside phosphotransferase (APT) family kinase protein